MEGRSRNGSASVIKANDDSTWSYEITADARNSCDIVASQLTEGQKGKILRTPSSLSRSGHR